MRLSSKPFRVEMSLFPPMATRRGQGLFGFKKMVTYHLVFITYYLSLNFHHSSFITHHLKHFIPFGTITHLSSLNIFQLLVSPIPVPCAAFFFFLFFPSTPSTHRTQEKKGIKKKKESKVKRCGCGSLHVCLITKMSLNYELWKLKTAKMCFQFP